MKFDDLPRLILTAAIFALVSFAVNRLLERSFPQGAE